MSRRPLRILVVCAFALIATRTAEAQPRRPGAADGGVPAPRPDAGAPPAVDASAPASEQEPLAEDDATPAEGEEEGEDGDVQLRPPTLDPPVVAPEPEEEAEGDVPTPGEASAMLGGGGA